MSDQTEQPRSVVTESRDLWNGKATYWDERFGEGNDFHQQLIEPAALAFLEPKPGQTILDLACGNGAFSRRLADLGAAVVACDFSAVFLERARARSKAYVEQIDYREVDATDGEQLLALGEGRFDAVVANMALMDMPTIDPLATVLNRLLKPEGHFVFTVQHPCFNSNAVELMAETGQQSGREIQMHSIKVTAYLDVPAGLGTGMPGEPNPHLYFHRPLAELLAPFLAHGFVLDGLNEPAFPREENPRPLSWAAYHQIPPVLAVRMRAPTAPA